MSRKAKAVQANALAPIVAPATMAMTTAQAKVVGPLTTVSARIRYLNSEGYSRSDITKLIPNAKGNQLIYQHVRGVLVQKQPAAS